MLRQSSPSAPTPNPKTQIAQRNIAVPIPPRASNRNTALPAQPAPLFAIAKSHHVAAQNPHRRHHRRRQLGPRFPPLRLFGRLPPWTPASVRLLTAVSGRRPKTLNSSGSFKSHEVGIVRFQRANGASTAQRQLTRAGFSAGSRARARPLLFQRAEGCASSAGKPIASQEGHDRSISGRCARIEGAGARPPCGHSR